MPSEIELEKNLLLSALRRAAPGEWQKGLQWVDLPLGKVQHEPHEVRRFVYFPITAVISMLYVLSDGSLTELCVVGNEGTVGLSSLLSDGASGSCALVQAAGSAVRLNTETLKQEFARRERVAELVLRYIQVLIAQMSQTAVCNRHHTIEEHLCRWILIMRDRLSGDTISTTQEMIATMLGVRRAGVNQAANQLQREGLITHNRGRITITNRRGLEARVCECYAVIKFEYDRLAPAFDAIASGPPSEGLRTDKGRLEALRRLDILDSPAEKFFSDIVLRASRLFDAPIAMVSFMGADRDCFKACICFEATEAPAETSFLDIFFRTTQDVVIAADTLDDRRFAAHPSVRGMPFIRFYAAARLMVHGETVGALCVFDSKPRRVVDSEQARAFESLGMETILALSAREAAADQLTDKSRYRESQDERYQNRNQASRQIAAE